MGTKLDFYKKIEEIVKEILEIKTDCLLIIVDVNISSIYKDLLQQLTSTQEKKILIYKAIAGEELKSFKEFEKCVNYFLESGIHRKAHLVSIGGGVTSDFSGFVAASLLRGISWSVVPTTLLSMVDASVGGKVGLNVDCGKNLIGAFHLPDQVWICHRFLKTLPDMEMKSGKGEILKYIFLDDNILEYIKSDQYDFYKLINKCAQFKLDLTKEDFKETNKRKILNLGHTFGHAIEKYYNLSHGISVVLGMLIIFLINNDQKSLDELSDFAKLVQLGDCEIPWLNKTFPLEDLFLYINKDKKIAQAGIIDLVILKNNKPIIEAISVNALSKLVEGKKDELKKILL